MILYVIDDVKIDNESYVKGDVIDVSPVRAEFLLSSDCFSAMKPTKKRKAKEEGDNVQILLHN